MMNEVKSEHTFLSGQMIKIVHGDITEEQVDAIVNAANSHLAHGGGVAGAIVRKGGADIQRESNEWVDKHGPVPTGGAAITGAGKLPCKAVIHAVGPIWYGGNQNEDENLRSAAWSSFTLADEKNLQSISLPAISSGIFGFPVDRCAGILLRAAHDFFQTSPQSSLREIRFILFDRPTLEIFLSEFGNQFST